MKFTVMGFSQKKLIHFKMDLVDAMILRYFIDFKDSGDMTMIIHDKEPYYWLQYDSLTKNIPIINIKDKDALRKRLKKMVDTGILKHFTFKKGGNFSYYAVGKNYKNLIKEVADEKPEPSGSKTGTLPVEKQEPSGSEAGTNNSSIKDSSIKDNYIYKTIVDYLNKTLSTNYRSSGNTVRRLIDARLNEGFKEDDFFKVIDNKFNEWNGTEWAPYLRPETLFGPKFETYLNQKKARKKSKGNFNSYEQRTYDYESLERKLLGLDGVD